MGLRRSGEKPANHGFRNWIKWLFHLAIRDHCIQAATGIGIFQAGALPLQTDSP
jgi:hypothetical protein